MRYEFKLGIRIVLALILVLLPFNIFQILFEKLLFITVLIFLELINASPEVGSYSVRNAITIFGGEISLKIVKYCVTASAYYTLALLILLTKGISFLKSVFLFLLGCFLIYLMNFIRIIILIIVLLQGAYLFDSLHTLFWFLLSFFYVIIMWVLFSRIFKIWNIPIYSDFKTLYKQWQTTRKN